MLATECQLQRQVCAARLRLPRLGVYCPRMARATLTPPHRCSRAMRTRMHVRGPAWCHFARQWRCTGRPGLLQTRFKITTGAKAMDEVLGGGLETGCITEVRPPLLTPPPHQSALLATASCHRLLHSRALLQACGWVGLCALQRPRG
jgi:hypothetical protein